MKSVLVLISSILLISLIVFRNYVFGPCYLLNSEILSDIIRANVPAYIHMYDALVNGLHNWSWSMGAGTSMFSHADIYLDPFVYILFIFGRNKIIYMLVWMLIIKLIAQGVSFFFFAKGYKIADIPALIASILYAFCGYSIIMGSNFALGTVLVYAPMALLGVEHLIRKDKAGLLIISLFLIGVQSYYYFYITSVGCSIFLFVRLYRDIYNMKCIFLKFCLYCMLSLGLSSFIILPQLELVLESPRGASNSNIVIFDLIIPKVKILVTAILRSFSNNSLGDVYKGGYVGYTYNGHDYFEQSTFITTLFLFFVNFCLYNTNKKEFKRMIAILCIMISIPFFSFAFNAFRLVNYRWEFFISIFQCLLIAYVINIIIEKDYCINKTIYIASYIESIFFVLIGNIIARDAISLKIIDLLKLNSKCVTKSILWITFIYFIFWVCIELLRHNYKSVSKICLPIICLLITFDIAYNYHKWYFLPDKSISTFSEKRSFEYFDTSHSLLKCILPTTNTFYRINKNFDSVMTEGGRTPSNNDAMIQNYYGLKNYNSLPNSNYMQFLQSLGFYCAYPPNIAHYQKNGIKPNQISGAELNYINGVDDNTNMMRFMGVRYLLTKNILHDPTIKLSDSKNGINVYDISPYMPLIFAQNNTIDKSEFLKFDNKTKKKLLINNVVIESQIASVNNIEHEKNDKNLLGYIRGHADRVNIISFSDDYIQAKIEVQDDALFLCTTIPYDKNWNIFIDGKLQKTEKVNIGFIGCKINSGKHNIEIKYIPRYLMFGVGVSFLVLLIVIFVNFRFKVLF